MLLRSTSLFLLFTLHLTMCTANTAPDITINTSSSIPTATVSESAPIGTLVAEVRVQDPDSGTNGQFTCSISGSAFALESVEGNPEMYNIKTAVYLDREMYAQYEVRVTCTDQGEYSLSHTQILNIQVEDVNDNAPVFPSSQYTVNIDENTDIGDTVLRVQAIDMDIRENGHVVHSLGEEGQDFLTINRESGEIAIKPAIIDRRVSLPQIFRVIATDNGIPRRSSEALVNFLFSGQNC